MVGGFGAMGVRFNDLSVNVNALAWELVHKTELPFQTVRSLLVGGWSYVENPHRPPMWVAPRTRLKESRGTGFGI